jgi:hypothetical protein
LSGANSVEEALEIQQQLIQLTRSGGFHIYKWSSNHPDLLKSVPAQDREIQEPLELDSSGQVKTLGVLWDPKADVFTFKVSPIVEQEFTKRKVASYAAKTYDPTGLIQPVIITAKIILQELWESKIEWDQAVPDSILRGWMNYIKELPYLESLQIPRHIVPNNPFKIDVHGFSDAC